MTTALDPALDPAATLSTWKRDLAGAGYSVRWSTLDCASDPRPLARGRRHPGVAGGAR